MSSTRDRTATNRRVPLRTIEDLERHEQTVIEAERDAAQAIAALLRELAVRLPEESRLIRRFATQADTLELFSRSGGPVMGVIVARTLDAFVFDLVQHFEEGES